MKCTRWRPATARVHASGEAEKRCVTDFGEKFRINVWRGIDGYAFWVRDRHGQTVRMGARPTEDGAKAAADALIAGIVGVRR